MPFSTFRYIAINFPADLLIPDEEILELKPLATLVGGKVVYQDQDYEVNFLTNLVR